MNTTVLNPSCDGKKNLALVWSMKHPVYHPVKFILVSHTSSHKPATYHQVTVKEGSRPSFVNDNVPLRLIHVPTIQLLKMQEVLLTVEFQAAESFTQTKHY